IVFGSAVGGGIHFNKVSSSTRPLAPPRPNVHTFHTLPQKYQEWKDNLPDFKWIKDYIPDDEKQRVFKDSLLSLKARLSSEDGLFNQLSKNAQETIEQFREMLKARQSENGNTLVIDL